MPRARKGAARTQARRKLLREARGFFGTKSRHKQQAKVAMMRAKRYAWRDRREGGARAPALPQRCARAT